jgi:6-pyruvoyltetrahydropterin/6-carboxytetrahydropterin synthase
MTYRSTKTYGHEVGLSACFRQWRAQSHCRFLHGYALSVHVEFEADELDERHWVVDFGSLKSFKGVLEDTFDHKLLVAEDDPMLHHLNALDSTDGGLNLAQLVIVPATGCEAFAKLIFDYVGLWLMDNGYSPRVRCNFVTVREHAGNSASYYREADK